MQPHPESPKNNSNEGKEGVPNLRQFVREEMVRHYSNLQSFCQAIVHGTFGKGPHIAPFGTHIAVMAKLSEDFWKSATENGFSQTGGKFPSLSEQQALLATAKDFYEGKIELIDEQGNWIETSAHNTH